MSHKNKRSEYFKKYRKENAEYFNQKHKEWRQRNRKQFACNYKFQKYKSKNNIVPEKCSLCFEEKSEAHHFDYEKPLRVIWLCKDCHEWLHKMNMDLPENMSISYEKEICLQ